MIKNSSNGSVCYPDLPPIFIFAIFSRFLYANCLILKFPQISLLDHVEWYYEIINIKLPERLIKVFSYSKDSPIGAHTRTNTAFQPFG